MFLQLKYLPAAAPLRLNIAAQGNSAWLSFFTALPTNYHLQANDTLLAGQWSNIATIPGLTTLSNVTIGYPMTNSPRFFRLLLGP